MSSFKKGRNSADSPRGNSRERYKSSRSFSKNKSYRERGNEEAQSSDKPKRRNDFSGEKKFDKPYRKPFGGDEKPRRSFDKEKKSFDKPFKSSRDGERSFSRDEKPKRAFDKDRERKPFDKPSDKKPFQRDDEKPKRNFSGDDTKKSYDKPRGKKPFGNKDEEFSGKRVKYDEFQEGKAFKPHEKREDFKHKKSAPKKSSAQKSNDDGLIRLNKYLSNAGVASRREADNLILSGAVKVNGVVVNQLGAKINPNDKISYGDESVKSERKVYLLLNKPKDYITTMDDPQERRTVMELLKGACRERIYSVGRLDRNTTGLLLFTNDGELTTKLTHPKFGIKKVYHVTLNKGLKTDDFKSMIEGVELEDGIIKADDLAFVGEGKKEIGIEIHSGRNRIVRRLFEHLGYDVIKLDRVSFAGLSKKDLPRGKYRFLTAKEVSFLKMIG